MITILLIFGVFMILSMMVSNRLKSKFKKYAQIPVPGGMTGRVAAERMLRENGIQNVQVISVNGELTDHYNPMKKTVNLSSNVYNQSSVSAVAVAAHECGHAIQHANAYRWLNLRSTLVPVVSFSSRWVQWILLAGILMVEAFPSILLIGIILFATTTLFSFITLPVEMDASKRALAWLNRSRITDSGTHQKAEDALKWASYTYVVAALGSLATLLYYVMIFLGAARD